MDNFMRQQVAVFYKNRTWAENVFEEFLAEYGETYDVTRCIKSVNNMSIEFSDGSKIVFLRANESSRGTKNDRVIMEPGIDLETINCIIKPTMVTRYRRPALLYDDGIIL